MKNYTDKDFWSTVAAILKDPELSKEFFKKMREMQDDKNGDA